MLTAVATHHITTPATVVLWKIRESKKERQIIHKLEASPLHKIKALPCDFFSYTYPSMCEGEFCITDITIGAL